MYPVGYVGMGIVVDDVIVGLQSKGAHMKFTQYYLDCLSQASYLIGDETTGRAVVVDPRRDIDEYVRDAAADGLTIELVIETHFHADFLSGHLELAAATGADRRAREARRQRSRTRRRSQNRTRSRS